MQNNIKKRVAKLLKVIGEGVYEKEHILALGLLSCIAGESIFLLGPPGTAKSMVARRLKEAFQDKRAFEYLMSRFSTPDELFGPVSISKLKNEDTYERCVEGFLPTATIVFLDEIWKAGPAIQNALLTVINEKIFLNGTQTIHLPMKGLVAASNELPAEEEGLEALWDRFLVRIVSNCISDERTFYKMLRQRNTREVMVAEELCITNEQYKTWQEKIVEVEIPDEILRAISYVRRRLKEKAQEEKLEPMDYYISDRRWMKIVHLLQASAFLNNRKQIDRTDLFLLYHTLWNRTECIPTVLEIVTDALFADSILRLEKIEKTIEAAQKKIPTTTTAPNTSAFKLFNYFYFKLEHHPLGTCYFYASDYKYLHTQQETEGVMYRNNKAHFIRRFDMKTPFSTTGIGENVQTVKLKYSPGCLIVDEKVYPIIKEGVPETDSNNIQPMSAECSNELEQLLGELLPIKEKTKEWGERLKEKDNLFVSADDLKLAKKRLGQIEKLCESLEIKGNNLLQL